MTDEARNTLLHDLRWGVGLGAAVVLSTQILTWIGLGLTHWTWISTYLLVIVFSVLAVRSLRDHRGAVPGLGRAALTLLVMILVSRVIYQTYMYCYLTFIDPTWVDTVATVWSTQLREAGTAEELISQQIASFRRQWEPAFIFSLGIISFVIPQFVLGFAAVVLGVARPWRRSSPAPEPS